MPSAIVFESLFLCVGFLLNLFVASMESALLTVPQILLVAPANEDSKMRRLRYWFAQAPVVQLTMHFVWSLSMLVCVAILVDLSSVSLFNERLIVRYGVLTVTVTTLYVAQLIARCAGRTYGVAWAQSGMIALRGLVVFFRPITALIELVLRSVEGSLSKGKFRASPFWRLDEISDVAVQGRHQILGEPEREMLSSIISFSDTVIREIMVPRTDMTTMSLDADVDEVRNVVCDAAHSRIPVYDETIDHVCGLLHVKDLFVDELKAQREGRPYLIDIKSILRTTFFVPEIMKISELLREFQRRKTHMAIVVDEYGGTAGVVTLEDIIEEIVGEIQDEYDTEDKQLRFVADQKLIADGRINLTDLADVLGVSFPDDPSYETLAGFLTVQSGYLPKKGDKVLWHSLQLTVKEADERRIAWVEIDCTGLKHRVSLGT